MRLQRAHLDVVTLHQFKQHIEMFTAGQWLVALDVDVDVGRDRLRDFVDSVGAAAMLRRGHATVPAVLAADGGDLVRVGGDDYVFEAGAGASRLVHVGEHRTAGDLAQHLARQASGGEASRNDGDGFHPLVSCSRRGKGKRGLAGGPMEIDRNQLRKIESIT